jgi:hypothetical protein
LIRVSLTAAASAAIAAWRSSIGWRMISIPITGEAYEALKSRNPGMDQDQTSRGLTGQLRIWADRTFLDRLLELRHPGEGYSDVIMRLAKAS